MHRLTIHANEDTDVSEELAKLADRCRRKNLSDVVSEHVVERTRPVLESLVANGRVLAKSGSQMQARRVIDGEGVSIHVSFQVNVRPSLSERLLRMLRIR